MAHLGLSNQNNHHLELCFFAGCWVPLVFLNKHSFWCSGILFCLSTYRFLVWELPVIGISFMVRGDLTEARKEIVFHLIFGGGCGVRD